MKADKHETAPFLCDTCKARFRNMGALRLHVQERHPESTQDVTPAGLLRGLNSRGQLTAKKRREAGP